MTSMTRITTSRKSAPVPATEVLRRSLVAVGYSQWAASSIANVVAATGCVHDAVAAGFLEPFDEQIAESIFCTALDALHETPYDSPEWDDPARWAAPLRAEDFAEDDDFDDITQADVDAAAAALADLEYPRLAPACGGSDEAEPFEPSQEDWAAACEMFREPEPFVPSAADWEDYRRHFDQVEPRYGYE